jgi:hypothetical protein
MSELGVEFRKLSANGDSVALTLPKDDLRERGVVDDEGEIQGDQWVRVESDESGYSVELCEAGD